MYNKKFDPFFVIVILKRKTVANQQIAAVFSSLSEKLSAKKRRAFYHHTVGFTADREMSGRTSGQTPYRNAAGALTGRGNVSGKAAQSLWPLLPNRSSG